METLPLTIIGDFLKTCEDVNYEKRKKIIDRGYKLSINYNYKGEAIILRDNLSEIINDSNLLIRFIKRGTHDD